MPPKTVLIADDDHDLLAAMALRCRAMGLDVRTTDNSLDLLNQINDDPPDLACIDVEMPFGTGLSACEMFATVPELAHMSVIIMTGRSDPDTIRRCHSLSAFYVLKCANLWPRLEPLIISLLKLEPDLALCGAGDRAGRLL